MQNYCFSLTFSVLNRSEQLFHSKILAPCMNSVTNFIDSLTTKRKTNKQTKNTQTHTHTHTHRVQVGKSWKLVQSFVA